MTSVWFLNKCTSSSCKPKSTYYCIIWKRLPEDTYICVKYSRNTYNENVMCYFRIQVINFSFVKYRLFVEMVTQNYFQFIFRKKSFAFMLLKKILLFKNDEEEVFWSIKSILICHVQCPEMRLQKARWLSRFKNFSIYFSNSNLPIRTNHFTFGLKNAKV